MRYIIAIAVLVALNTRVSAEGSYQSSKELRLVQLVHVHVDDQVIGGCLPQPDILKSEAELILRRSGTSLANNLAEAVAATGGYTLHIEPIGYALSSPWDRHCIARLSIQLYRMATVPEGHYALVVAYEHGSLANRDKADLPALLREDVSVIITDLANEILKARSL